VGQFEYTVGLSAVKPEDIPQLAKEYLAKKEQIKKEADDKDE
jgi:hypothetical protein